MKYKALALLLALILCPAAYADITPNGVLQGELVTNLYDNQQMQYTYSLTDLDMSYNSTDNVTIDCTNSGLAYYLNGIEFIPATSAMTLSAAVQQNGTITAYYLITWDASADTVEVTKAADSSTDIPALIASIDSTNIPLCLLKVVNTATVTFTLGTTSFETSGIAETFYDIVGMPNRRPTITVRNTER